MSRFLAPILCFLVLASTLRADDKPKPNALTPEEIADGWIMLFDGGTTFGWKIDGDAKVEEGKLIIGGKEKSTASLTTEFSDYDLRVETDPSKGWLTIQTDSGSSLGLSNQSMLIYYTIRLKPGNSQITVTGRSGPDGIERTTAQVIKSGPSRVIIESKPGEIVSVKSVALRLLGTKPLFNGKNLEGWKVNAADPKRVATKFDVTPEGELSAKNGPGDLQTEKQFDDFVLQLECKTNGLALNSGLFFRCMPDAYQNGYEAQIQNAYLLDRTKPVDFGTGAIYRRVKARKVVSNDKEWFTMTVAAQGAHFATWVNGYQTVDWTDDRKANDNPRQGLRTAKGHLSIQGHDPTTDLLFRNLRIAELPKPLKPLKP